MREIKFRGKRIDNGKWVYGDIYIDRDKFGILTTEILGGSAIIDEVYPNTVGQFTGKKCKKTNKEIYGGQKVRGFYDRDLVGKNEYHYEDGKVVWNNELGCFAIDNDKIKPSFSCFESFEIIMKGDNNE
jgi:hypothetical protein